MLPGSSSLLPVSRCSRRYFSLWFSLRPPFPIIFLLFFQFPSAPFFLPFSPLVLRFSLLKTFPSFPPSFPLTLLAPSLLNRSASPALPSFRPPSCTSPPPSVPPAHFLPFSCSALRALKKNKLSLTPPDRGAFVVHIYYSRIQHDCRDGLST